MKQSHHAVRHQSVPFNLKKNDTRMIDLCSIVDNPMQPKGRCDNVKELYDAIRATGTLAPIIVVADPNVPNRYIICNGHRRFIVALMLGLKQIEVILVTGNHIKLWVENNLGAKQVSGNQYWNAWANCTIQDREIALNAMPKKSARQLRCIVALLGVDETQIFGLSAEHSPACVESVKRFVNAMTASGVTVSMAETLRWALTFNMIKKITSLLKFKGALTKLLSTHFNKAITGKYGVNIEMNDGKFTITPTVPLAPVDRKDNTLLDTIVGYQFDQDAQDQLAAV